MRLKAGIVGLPNVGKSTIFNALTESGIPAENYPFCTIEPNVGIVEVPDSRLDKLTEIFNPKSTLPATMEFVDIAGLVKGASQGEGLGNQFLSHIRDVHAIVHVLRAFEEDNITHVEGNTDPIRDVEIIETELLIRDIATVDKRLDKVQKTAKSGDKEAKEELCVLEAISPEMNDGVLVRDILLDSQQRNILQRLNLLTAKPALYVANVDENEIMSARRSPQVQMVVDFATSKNNSAIRLCGKLESEISTLPKDEKSLFLEEYNLPEPGLNKLINASYALLGLETFFTCGPNEVRAWTIKKGMTAPQAAGEIHTDFERGFIKAEVYRFDEIISAGSESKLRDRGKIRQEGKSYIVEDGDVIFFKFNV